MRISIEDLSDELRSLAQDLKYCNVCDQSGEVVCKRTGQDATCGACGGGGELESVPEHAFTPRFLELRDLMRLITEDENDEDYDSFASYGEDIGTAFTEEHGPHFAERWFCDRELYGGSANSWPYDCINWGEAWNAKLADGYEVESFTWNGDTFYYFEP